LYKLVKISFILLYRAWK